VLPLSFEFFPPKTEEQRRQLARAARKLRAFRPEYVSVTFGAGGSTLSYTPETVAMLRRDFGFDAVPHLSCIGGTRAEIAELLGRYEAMGCTRIVALRGDLPSGMVRGGDFRYAADLVRFIRERHDRHFRIEVACYPECHPQASDFAADLRHFAAKVAAGADAAITQYFFNPDAYFRFVEAARRLGVTIPIVPGIMPIANVEQLKRFSAACGAEIPRWLDRHLERFAGDEEALRDFAADVVSELCRRLSEGGAPGFHFYTLNLARPTIAVLERLGYLPLRAIG
jgi:methylenetetrahydrofolate reductase (NADPH)